MKLEFLASFFKSSTHYQLGETEYVRRQNHSDVKWYVVDNTTGVETLVDNELEFEMYHLLNTNDNN